MRNPIYKSRPVEPNPARLGAERINDFIVLSEGYSNVYLIQTSEGDIQVNAGIFFEAPVHERNFGAFSKGSLVRSGSDWRLSNSAIFFGRSFFASR